ncbi:MAG: hypothetical protein WD080_03655 [Egibacteraceae bacterium]
MKPCADCGGERVYVRSPYEIVYPTGRLKAKEVPSVRCEVCGHTDPAPHARSQVEAVLELVQEVEGVATKDFSGVPLRPDGQPD